jgi:hypothetical protein
MPGAPQPQTSPPVPAQFTPGVSPPGPPATTGDNPNTPAPAMDDSDQSDSGQSQAPPAPASASQPSGVPDFGAQPAPGAPSLGGADMASQLGAIGAQNPAAATKQELDQHDLDWQSDLANGHITPETYGSLFAKKDTLGKIGSVFGMLLSGAGSGLAHQPNALLGLMQNQIDNDLKAQEQSKTNAQNFLRLNQQRLMNDAQIGNLNAETATKAYALSQAQMLQSSYHKLVTSVNGMPDGQQKQQAVQTLGMLYQGIQGKINDVNDQAAGATAYGQMLFGNQSGASGDDAFKQRNNALAVIAPEKAKYESERYVPGIGSASKPVPKEVQDKIIAHQNLDNALKDLQDFTSKNTTILPGTPEYTTGHVKAQLVQTLLREGLLNTVYREGEQPLLDKLIKGNPANLLKQFNTVPQMQELQRNNTSQFNTLKKNYGLPASSSDQGAPQTMKTKSGRTAINQGGKWYYQ